MERTTHTHTHILVFTSTYINIERIRTQKIIFTFGARMKAVADGVNRGRVFANLDVSINF